MDRQDLHPRCFAAIHPKVLCVMTSYCKCAISEMIEGASTIHTAETISGY